MKISNELRQIYDVKSKIRGDKKTLAMNMKNAMILKKEADPLQGVSSASAYDSIICAEIIVDRLLLKLLEAGT